MSKYKTIDFINENFDIHDVYEECFGRPLRDCKIVCPNPEHHHVNNTPSAKCYGNMIKCFGACNRVFGPYDLYKWYKPEKIEEIRSTYLYTPKQQENKQMRLKPVAIDRTKPISEIIRTIVNGD